MRDQLAHVNSVLCANVTFQKRDLKSTNNWQRVAINCVRSISYSWVALEKTYESTSLPGFFNYKIKFTLIYPFQDYSLGL
jgi:hypothetical protein